MALSGSDAKMFASLLELKTLFIIVIYDISDHSFVNIFESFFIEIVDDIFELNVSSSVNIQAHFNSLMTKD